MENKNKGSNQNQQNKRMSEQRPGMQNGSQKMRNAKRPTGGRRPAAAPGNKRTAPEKVQGGPFLRKNKKNNRQSAAPL